jgi:hypothetical protein
MKAGTFTLKPVSLPGNYSKAFKVFIYTLILIPGLLVSKYSNSQCLVGYSSAQINWDNLDYLVTAGNYSGFVTASMAANQRFTIGTNAATIALSASMTPNGENGTHIANIAGYTGDDAQFTPGAPNQTITITFDNEVMNANFTLYDIDRQQAITVTAANTLLVPQVVNVATYAGSILTVAGLPTSPTITSNNTNLSLNSEVSGAATISVTGPVKSITITVTTVGSEAIFWLSDINACVTGSFPNNYFLVSRPFNGGMAGGQPAYFLNILDDSVFITNPVNGQSKFLFEDVASLGKVNSVGYDPYNHIMYFVYSLTGSASTNKTLRKYDFNTETFSTVTTDITSLVGIPTFTQGVESGAAAFYNGSLYVGIEGSNSSRNSGREHIIWKIDFDASGAPIRSTQFAGTPSDGGGTLLHDWSDFIISNGILYDFDGAQSSPNIYHYNMMTGAKTTYNPAFRPTQVAVTWNESIYEVGSNSTLLYAAGHVQPYNLDGTVNGAQNFPLVMPPGTTLMGSWGDASEAFRPKSDFGDAPASYDPDPLAPATHERITTLRLGSSYDYEWNLTSSALANADGADEDAIGAAPALNYDATLTYSIPNISVFNNTGGNATLIGWLDYNFNNVFESGEGVSITVPSSGSAQLVTLTWNNIYVPLTLNVRTFLRLRLTRAVNSMTTANMNGWYPDGEVEDYPVLLGAALPKDVITLGLDKKDQSSVKLNWNVRSENPIAGFEVLKSTDNQNWKKIASVGAIVRSANNDYSYTDIDAEKGVSYYRIRVNYATADNMYRFSEVKSIRIDHKGAGLRIQPNPVINKASLQLSAPRNTNVSVDVLDVNGKIVMQLSRQVSQGINTIQLDRVATLPAGIYTIRASVDGEILTTKFIKSQQ